jgi:hypothetical protein
MAVRVQILKQDSNPVLLACGYPAASQKDPGAAEEIELSPQYIPGWSLPMCVCMQLRGIMHVLLQEEEEKHQRFQDACHFHSSEMAERRVRLVVGLKRYFHGKRLEGLLSVKVPLPLTPLRSHAL